MFCQRSDGVAQNAALEWNTWSLWLVLVGCVLPAQLIAHLVRSTCMLLLWNLISFFLFCTHEVNLLPNKPADCTTDVLVPVFQYPETPWKMDPCVRIQGCAVGAALLATVAWCKGQEALQRGVKGQQQIPCPKRSRVSAAALGLSRPQDFHFIPVARVRGRCSCTVTAVGFK